ncbi:hypothetical protein V2G26_014190 [Clonostachys chloroleuca]
MALAWDWSHLPLILGVCDNFAWDLPGSANDSKSKYYLAQRKTSPDAQYPLFGTLVQAGRPALSVLMAWSHRPRFESSTPEVFPGSADHRLSRWLGAKKRCPHWERDVCRPASALAAWSPAAHGSPSSKCSSPRQI